MFTLTDSRMQAWQQAAGAAGGALGQSLGKYIENKRLQQALGEVTPEMSLQEKLKVYSQHGLSPATQERLTSPTMIQQQNLERGRQALKNIDWTDITPQNLPQKLAEITQALAGTGLERNAGEILNAFAAQARAKGFGKPYQPEGIGIQGAFGGGAGIQKKTPKTATETKPTMEVEEPSAYPETTTTGRPTPGRKDFRTTPQVDRPLPPPLTAEDKLAIYNQALNQTGSHDMALQQVELYQASNTEQRAAQMQQIAADELQREKLLGTEKTIHDQLLNNIEEDYPQGLESYLHTWLDKMVLEGKGKIEDRYRYAKNEIDTVKDRLASLSEMPKRIRGAVLRPRAYEKYLKDKQDFAEKVYEVPNLPEYVRIGLMDQIRQASIDSGDGIVEAELISNRPTDENMKVLKSVGKPKKMPASLAFGAGGGTGISARNAQKAQEIKDSNIEKLSNAWFKIAGGMTSPLIARSFWVDEGYTEDEIKEAYLLAQKRGAAFSPYQETQFTKLSIPERPSLTNLYFGEKTIRKPFDILFTGVR